MNQTTFEGIPDIAQKTVRAEAPAQIGATERQVPAARLPDWCRALPALSIRQPWAWMILNAGKRIENRCWQTHFRGWFLIHAAKGCTVAEYEDALDFALDIRGSLEMPSLKELHRGGIVGAAKLGNCVRGSDSPWFVGEWGFVLDEVKPLDFVPCKGALGFFTPSNLRELLCTTKSTKRSPGGA